MSCFRVFSEGPYVRIVERCYGQGRGYLAVSERLVGMLAIHRLLKTRCSRVSFAGVALGAGACVEQCFYSGGRASDRDVLIAISVILCNRREGGEEGATEEHFIRRVLNDLCLHIYR